MPWVHQWHGERDEEWDGTPAEEYQAYLDEQRAKHGLSAEDLKRVPRRPLGGQPCAANSTRAAQPAEVTDRMGPILSFESRTWTVFARVATSTHSPPAPLL